MEEYITKVIVELNKCEQFENWSFDDLFTYLKEENLLNNLVEFYLKGISVQDAVDKMDAFTWCFM